jgi:hypothetical protein
MNEKLTDYYPWNLPQRDVSYQAKPAGIASAPPLSSSGLASLNEYIHQLLLLSNTMLCYDSSLLISSHHSGAFLWKYLLIKIMKSLASIYPFSDSFPSLVPSHCLLLIFTIQSRNSLELLLRKHVSCPCICFSL